MGSDFGEFGNRLQLTLCRLPYDEDRGRRSCPIGDPRLRSLTVSRPPPPYPSRSAVGLNTDQRVVAVEERGRLPGVRLHASAVPDAALNQLTMPPATGAGMADRDCDDPVGSSRASAACARRAGLGAEVGTPPSCPLPRPSRAASPRPAPRSVPSARPGLASLIPPASASVAHSLDPSDLPGGSLARFLGDLC